MTFNRFLAGVVLIAGVTYLGYIMEIPMPLVIGTAVVLAICCILSGL
jgi:hypothetical protein